MGGRHYQRARARVRAVAPAFALALTLGGTLAASVASPASAQAASAQAASARFEAPSPVCFSAAHPKLAARLSNGIMAALRGRRSLVGLTFADTDLRVTCKVNRGGHFYAASVIKVTIISALLEKIGGPSHLTAAQRSLAWSMITESDNNSATKLWNEVGLPGMQRFLDLAGMTHTELNAAWGLTRITAQDELTLLRVLTSTGKVLSTASRSYVLRLMTHVISTQRWGVSEGAPSGVTVHIKNGWLPYPTGSDWRINSIGAFTGPHINYLIAALTSQNPSMEYGIDTIQAAARVINRDLAEF
jgi:beta-lactamase class A